MVIWIAFYILAQALGFSAPFLHVYHDVVNDIEKQIRNTWESTQLEFAWMIFLIA